MSNFPKRRLVPSFSVAVASGTGSPIYVYDVKQDGGNDLMYGAGHHYGVFWLENRAGACQDHLIDNSWSQGHALTLADMDKDGRLDIVIGKRDLAHDIDPGAYEPLGTYWYRSEDASHGLWGPHPMAPQCPGSRRRTM